MNNRHIRSLLAFGLLGVLVGFGTTYALQAQQAGREERSGFPADALGDWLGLNPAEIGALRSVDPGFRHEREELESALAGERERLARLFEQSNVQDGELLAQVERVIRAHDALERRVARYLIAVRPYLSAEQQSRLFERCAGGVRAAGGWRWRHGRDEADNGMRRGGGPPGDRGRGRGRGRLADVSPAPPTTQASRPGSQPEGELP
ncbi:MAG: periplasmic heavy metal sensor [Phycisphaerae bacterium]|jgi:hypothetical protein